VLHSIAYYNIQQDAIDHPCAVIQLLRLLQTMMHHKLLLISIMDKKSLNTEQKPKLSSTIRSLPHIYHAT
jgi:hypothetical protein